MRYALAGIALALAACSLNVDGGGGFACEPDGTCRDGLSCVDSICLPDPPACTAAVGTGDGHSCAIRKDGTAWCWGRNDFGQLGDGSTTDQTTPVAVVAGSTKPPKFQAIAGGNDHTCALGSDGTVWCWGHNLSGQLGNTRTSDEHNPVQVSELTGATAIATGAEHSCALRGDHVVVCWGENGHGQIGNGGSAPQPSPFPIDSLHGVTAIAAGGNSTCAVDGNQALWCWGDNRRGQLGDGTRMQRATPVQITALTDVVGTAVGGEFACALSSPASGGKVSCFGLGDDGQLGRILNQPDSPMPVAVTFAGAAVSIVAGANFACLTDDQRGVWCWGENENTQLADATSDDRPIPVRTRYGDGAVVAGGGAHSCAVSASGALRCSGYNGRGQLGNARRTSQGSPQPVDGITDAVAIAAGNGHSCATLKDGTVMCWGGNDSGELGDGTWTARSRPAPVAALAGAQMVAAGLNHSCALVAGGGVVCWGLNHRGQLGDGTGTGYSRGYPLAVPGLTGVTQVAAGGHTTCALAGGAVSCWGQGDDGQLGNDATDDSDKPVAVGVLLPGVRGIAVGNGHACAINAAGTVSCWGANSGGQLGNNSTVRSALPVPVVGLSGVEQIAAADGFTCARTTASGVSCWGFGFNGEIGIDDFDQFSTPQRVTALPEVTRLVAGGSHACATKSSGALVCWGASYSGEVGDGYGNRGTPTLVAGNPAAIDIGPGEQHTCAVLDGGKLSCWGDDRSGQLGDGTFAGTLPIAPLLPCP